ncbi:hypothetical protein EVB71_062 [Rhizobium phage RHph_Y55]|nr:hypothetical protein EVB71_062 [Rhizobium phage RHph_Y55]
MNKFTFETAGIYYSRIFNDVAICWKVVDEIDLSIWKEQGKPVDFVAPRRTIRIGQTLGM